MKLFLIYSLLLFSSNCTMAQINNKNLVESVLRSKNVPILNQILNHPDEYRSQVIYVQINRDEKNIPHFTDYYYRYLPHEYWNPASTVKLPLAALALQKLNDINIDGVNKFTTIQYDSSYEKQTTEYNDASSETGFPSIAHYIKRAFLISENDPYNRLYQFIGQQTTNRDLHKMGYKDARIIRQFVPGLTEEQNRHTNQVPFLDKKGKLIYTQPPAYNKDSFDFTQIVKLGNAYMTMEDSLVNEPFDFTKHNRLSLKDLTDILRSIIFPESMPGDKKFRLSKDDYNFLRKYLSQYPSETTYPKYDTTEFFDSYAKFFFRDCAHHSMPANVRVFNKVGWAYGFLSDVSYILDKKNKVEFFLAATVYTNKDGVINDAKYDYEEIGHPFLYQLGQAMYEYELQRKYKKRPDLSDLIIHYDHRDPNEKRPAIKDVDN